VDRDGHRWHIEFGYVLDSGQLQPVSVNVTSARESPDGVVPVDVAYRRISTALLRSLPIASIEERARGDLVHRAAVRVALAERSGNSVRGLASEALREARRDLSVATGARQESLHLRLVAAVYTEAWRSGDRAPAKAVARYFSELRGETVTSVSARNWIRRCRQLGLLPPTTVRRARA
jgi:hypothetical protein